MKVLLKSPLFLLLCLFFFIRLIFLTKLPIFNDEAIYLNWGYREINDSNNLYYSLFDAKQPLLMWIFALAQKVIPDPLLAGRFVSVMFGYITLLGIYKIGIKIFNKHITILASLLYIFIPIFSFYDRQALMESAVSSIGVWACYLSYKIFNSKHSVKYILSLGILLGIGFFIKSSAGIFYICIVILFLFALWKQSFVFIKQKTVAILLTFLISQIVLVPLYSQGEFWNNLSSNSRYTLTISELLKLPIQSWFLTTKGMFEIMFWYLTPIVFLEVVIGVFLLVKNKTYKYFSLWLLVGLVILIIITRNISQRYIVSFLPLAVFPAAYLLFLLKDKKKKLFMALYVVTLAVPIFITTLQVTLPIDYFLTMSKLTTMSQIGEYVSDWPSGYGINEVRQLMSKYSQENKITIGVRADSGNPEDAIFTYYNASTTIRPTYINGYLIKPWSQNDNCVRVNSMLYFISRGNQLADLESYIEKEVIKIYKPLSHEYIGVYKLNTNCL